MSTTTTYRSEEERIKARSELARALARGGMDDVQILSLKEAEEVNTPKRREIIEALSKGEYESIRALARELDRDKGQVSRDLGLLAEHGIVTFDTDGRSKTPQLAQQHVLFESIV